jgi:hypothetical protein|tara:strand:- start:277 stop:453 length:177 start_codon:yes stop_codon:yes gene_type:complete
MSELNDVNMFVRLKGEQESLSPDWDSALPVKLKAGSRVIAKDRGQSIVQLPDGSIYKV